MAIANIEIVIESVTKAVGNAGGGGGGGGGGGPISLNCALPPGPVVV